MLSYLKRNFRLILLAIFAIAGGAHLYTAFLSSEIIDYSAGRELELRFIASLNFSLIEVPTTVNFSLSDIYPIPKFSEPQGDKIYVYDIQWIPTQAVIALFVSEKMVYDTRPPDIGTLNSISDCSLISRLRTRSQYLDILSERHSHCCF